MKVSIFGVLEFNTRQNLQSNAAVQLNDKTKQRR